jgi:hypothetical protein
MNRRNFLTALSCGSGTLLSLPAMTRTARPEGNIWQPDGSGWRARIGVLTPHFDPVPESEFWTMAPEGVSVHAARVQRVEGRITGRRLSVPSRPGSHWDYREPAPPALDRNRTL